MKIFSFIKDEIDIIDDWVRYHANIVGIKNIYVIDHSSTDGTSSILQKWKKLGLNLYNSNCAFRQKSIELTRLMNLNKGGFLIPLDADEFLVLRTGTGISAESKQIKEYVIQLPKEAFRFKMNQIDVIPSQTNIIDPLINITSFKTKWYEEWRKYAKTFYHSDFFISTDQGNHKGSVLGAGDDYPTALTIVHFDIRSYEHFVKKVTRGAIAYNHHLNKIATSGAGIHYHRRYWAINSGNGKQIMNKEFGVVGNFETTVLSDKLKSLR